jgi:hypothetical protein
MFLPKKHIPRRTFLRGAGVTLALPLLDAMVPALQPMRLSAAAPVKRFVGIWHPHGAAPGYWSPTKEGKDFDFSFITKPLEPFRNRTVLVTGLDIPEAMATTEEPGGDHARGAVLLSGARPRRNAVSPHLGITIDQIIANKYGQDNILASIQLGIEDDGNYGNCNWGYSCAYTNSVSWTSATQPLPTQVNPRVVFERLFGDGTNPEERLRGRKENASILDSVTRELVSFKKNLGVGDQARLDTYLDNIRELERRITIAMNNSVKEPSADVPFGLPESKHVHFRLMYDLMALAFEGDITRSATLMLGRDSERFDVPRVGLQWRLARIVAPRRQARERRQLLEDESLSRAEPGLLLRQAREDTGRGWHAARSHADLQGQQHGQLPPARAREGASDSRRRHRRHVPGEPAHRVRRQPAAHVESAARDPAQVRHRAGSHRVEHWPAADALDGGWWLVDGGCM